MISRRKVRFLRFLFMATLVLALAGCMRSPAEEAARHLKAAKALAQKKDYNRAILELKNAVRETPKNAEIYYQLGLAYGATGDLQGAADEFQRALSIDPDYKPARLQLSELIAVDGASSLLGDTETRLTGLLEESGPNPDALNALAVTELRLGKSEQAQQALLEATSKFPAQMTSALILAGVELKNKDIKGAEQALKNLAQNAPQVADVHTVLASFYTSQNRPVEAENELRQALAITPNSESALAQMAALDLATGKKDDAGQIYERLSQSSDKRFQPLYGLFLFQTGRKEDAIREFDRLAKADNRTARTCLIAAYMSLNRKAEAEKVLEAALRKNNSDLDALLQRGEIYLGDRQFAQAEADLNRVLRLRPNSPEIHYAVAKLHQALGSTLQYRQELDEALRLNAGQLAIRLELADSLMDDRDARAALALLEEAPPDQQKTEAWIAKHNWALWGVGDFGRMRKGIDLGLSSQRSAELLLQDGVWKLRAGDPAGARASLNEALRINPADVRAVEAMRDTYLAQKDGRMALSVVKELAARSPQSAPIQNFLALLLAGAGDHDAARAALASAKRADPKSLQADMQLVQLDVADKDLEGAEKRASELLTSDRENMKVRLWLGIIQEMRGEHSAALEQFRKVVEADPSNAQAMNNLAYLLLEYGKEPAEALKYAQRAVELAPDKPLYADTLGWVLYQKGLYSSAVTYLERASSAPDAICKYHLAMAYAKTGDRRDRTTLEAALKLNANLPEAKMAREVVGKAAQ
jgi:tetratricopeptide (TPR) repeat protein